MSFQKLWLLAAVVVVVAFTGNVCKRYKRHPPRKNLVGYNDDIDPTFPQQVHISLVGRDKMRISWITQHHTPATVHYGTSSGKYDYSANGTVSSYQYMDYTSGEIHEVVIGPLPEHNTIYYYWFGGSSPEYSFKTPPARFPIKFVVSGDLGQSEWTLSTLQHIEKSNYDVLILPGDLSYADMAQRFWDSFGRLVEPLASRRPWMVTEGDHETEIHPLEHMKTPFTAYNARWHMPYEESLSTSNLYYSFEVSKVHWIMLGSYAEFGHGSDQYKWLENDLRNVNRTKTPWLFVVVHAPWYNSNGAHQGDKESVGMRESMEELLYNARVDIVFAGHVHAYERFNRVYKQEEVICAPIYITIGDGGNSEGLVPKLIKPQPEILAFREASFGHGELIVASESFASWSWRRNDDDESVQADTLAIQSLASDPLCNNPKYEL